MTKGFVVHPRVADRYAKLRFLYSMPPHGTSTEGLSYKMTGVTIAVKNLILGVSTGYYRTTKAR